MNFDSGAIATIFTTFDVYYETDKFIEIYGTKGTMQVPDPNGFGGPIKVLKPGEGYKEYPLQFEYPENRRALGLADMAKAIQTGREARCDYTQTLHVLEIMTSFQKASESGKLIELQTKYTRKAPMVVPTEKGVLDD